MRRVGIWVIYMLLGTSLAFARGQVSEREAIDTLKKATASRLDASLPRRPFGTWIDEKFKDWDVEWEMNDCGEGTGNPATDSKRDMPSCVQVDIMQPSQDEGGKRSRGFHLVFQVGSQKKGLLAVPKFRSATQQEDDAWKDLRSLSEVEP